MAAVAWNDGGGRVETGVKASEPGAGETPSARDGALAAIELRGVTKTYHSSAGDFQALRGIDLCVHSGQFVAVVGRSGSGKSTLANMITGIDRPTTGEVWVGGTPVHTLREGQMAPWRGRHLGVIFQFFQLLPTLTLLQNVMLPMDLCHTYPLAERRERAFALLASMGLGSLAHKLPSSVSGGHQQLTAIARALANEPPLLVADEPTGNLDSSTAEEVLAMFEQLVAKGTTVVMVTHDQDIERRATRTVHVVDGRLALEICAPLCLEPDVPALARLAVGSSS